MMGLIGWSVAIPTLLGAALGLWLDKHHPGKHSWTLALLVAGLVIGCLNAWRWVAKEDRAMRWPDSTLSPVVIGSGCWRVSWDLSSRVSS